jgi:peptidoglycan endopeptidase LytE
VSNSPSSQVPFRKKIIRSFNLIFLQKIVCLSVCFTFAAVLFTGSAMSQDRERVIKTSSSRPTNLPPTAAQPELPKVKPITASRPTLTTEIKVAKRDAAYEPLVKKTASSMPVAAPVMLVRSAYSAATTSRLDQAIKSRYGIRYRYGSSGPNTYDCSGFVWAAFQDAGIHFTRTSARSLWASSDPVEGDERFKFGTLVFLNGLGHMGIVADEKGFYHASSSKGITYSTFEGYWGKRINGFRKLRTPAPIDAAAELAKANR